MNLLLLSSSVFALLCVVSGIHNIPWLQGPNGKEYYQIPYPGNTKTPFPGKNKTTSRHLCDEVGGILPKPMNSEENDFLQIFSYSFYLGMNASDNANNFVWDDDGTAVQWFDDELSGVGDCVIVRPDFGWVKSSCTSITDSIVCEKKGWIQGPNGKQYIRHTLWGNKSQSTHLCNEAGGILPKPMNREESDFLKSFKEIFYIGMTYSDNVNAFVWDDDGTAVQWFDWTDAPSGTGDCVIVWTTLGWIKQFACHLELDLFCERKKPTSPQPTIPQPTSPQTTTPQPTTPQPTTPQRTTPPPNTTPFTCPTQGHWADPSDPTR